MVVAGGGTMATAYGTLATRAELATMSRTLPPALVGIYGDPVSVDTFGGFISWHYGAYFALLGGLWSILALSSTLAGEAKRGSLDFTAVTPRSTTRPRAPEAGRARHRRGRGHDDRRSPAWATGAVLGRFEGDLVAVEPRSRSRWASASRR